MSDRNCPKYLLRTPLANGDPITKNLLSGLTASASPNTPSNEVSNPDGGEIICLSLNESGLSVYINTYPDAVKLVTTCFKFSM